jgi:hypothetical protein
MDAAVLQLVGSKTGYPVSMTHDCVYARAGAELDWFANAIRYAFVDVVASDALDQFADINGVPDQLIEMRNHRNTGFDYDQIYGSKFLFC